MKWHALLRPTGNSQVFLQLVLRALKLCKARIGFAKRRKKLRRIIKAIELILRNLLRRFYEDFQAHRVNVEYGTTACRLSTMGGVY